MNIPSISPAFNPRCNAQAETAISFGEFGMGADGAAERGLYIEALRRLLSEAIERETDDLARKLYYLIRNDHRDLGLSFPGHRDADPPFDDADRERRNAMLGDILCQWPPQPSLPPSALQRRVDFLARTFGLAEHETAILGLLGRKETISRWELLLDKILRCESMEHARIYAMILDLSRDAVDGSFSVRGIFVKQGLASHECGSNGCYVTPHDYIDRFLASTAQTETEMVAALTPVMSPAALGEQDYAHLATELDRAACLIDKALKSGERANILLYGVPGTGKTEFARLLAAMHGAVAVSVGEADDDGDEPSRAERLSHLRLCRKLAGRNGAAILVIDEAEDLFLAGVEQRGSKLWLNKLVEDGKGPHIWIVNDAWLLGEPVVRRMDMAIRFDMPSGSARRAIVQRLVSNQITPLVADESDGKRLVEALADLHASPAILSAAMRTGAAMDGDAGCMISLARDLAEASGRTVVTPYTSHGAVFDPALSVADCDLVSLADKLAAATQNWSLLLSGPPGTGKSAYARHLAECAGCDLICRSGAELLGMYVGETEKQIASAFAEAERSKAILLIDEADSFLANRDTASRNWEVSMTNEMLRQMEGGRVRFLATTNRAASLDPASARRFTMRAEFSALDGARARKLFEASFGSAAPISLDRTAGLTPGDFAQVSQRAKLLCEADPERLVEWLADALKLRDGSKAKIGF